MPDRDSKACAALLCRSDARSGPSHDAMKSSETMPVRCVTAACGIVSPECLTANPRASGTK